MILDHVRVFTEDKKFTDGGIVIKDGRIAEVYTEGNCPAADGEEILDGQGMYAIPGLIDLHFHGVWGMISATVTGKLLKELRSMRLLWG